MVKETKTKKMLILIVTLLLVVQMAAVVGQAGFSVSSANRGNSESYHPLFYRAYMTRLVENFPHLTCTPVLFGDPEFINDLRLKYNATKMKENETIGGDPIDNTPTTSSSASPAPHVFARTYREIAIFNKTNATAVQFGEDITISYNQDEQLLTITKEGEPVAGEVTYLGITRTFFGMVKLNIPKAELTKGNIETCLVVVKVNARNAAFWINPLESTQISYTL